MTTPLTEGEKERRTPVRTPAQLTARAASMRLYRKNHPEKYRASNKAWADAHPEYERERSLRRAKENPKLHAMRAQAARMKISRRELQEMLARDCVYCGEPATEIDHIIPLTRGGTNIIENLAPACRACNASKKDKLLHEWRPDDYPAH